MKKLYLLRHANSPVGGDDHARILSAQGRVQAAAVAEYLRERGIVFDQIICSSALRTAETAQIATGHMGVIPRFSEELYLAGAEKLFAEIQQTAAAAQQVLVVGHNPSIADLAMVLGRVESLSRLKAYSPATLAVFACDVARWDDLSLENVTLEDVFIPPDVD
jgi:phosphohistidine phosphatase